MVIVKNIFIIIDPNLCPISGDHLVGPVIALQREVDLQEVVAGLDDAQDAVNLHPLHIRADPHLGHVVDLEDWEPSYPHR